MKKLVLFCGLMLLPIAVFCQADSTQVNPPGSWSEVLNNFSAWFNTLAAVSALTVFVAAFLNRIFKVSTGWVKQLVSWLCAIALCYGGNLLNLGFIADFPWLTTGIYGIAAGFVANGIFDINFVQTILDFIKLSKVRPPVTPHI